MTRKTLWPLVAALIAMSPLAASAQQAEQYTLRTYEVGDLTIRIEDRFYSEARSDVLTEPTPAGGGGGGFGGGFGGGRGGGFGGGGGVFSISHRSVRANFAQFGDQFGDGPGSGQMGGSPSITLVALIDTLIASVDPGSWAEQGGEGVVSAVGTALVVRQTPAAHAQIEGLLGALRSGSAGRRTLAIDARWLTLTSDELDRLRPQGSGEIDRKVLEAYTRRESSTRGVTNCFSGQHVYLVSGTRRNTVSGYIPVVGSLEAAAGAETLVSHQVATPMRLVSETSDFVVPRADKRSGYQPIITPRTFGAVLEIRPTHFPQTKKVVVDLMSTITTPAIGDGVPRVSPGPPHVDRVAIETQEFATTMRAPLGKPTLVGGMTYAQPGAQPQQGAEQPQLYLVLEVR